MFMRRGYWTRELGAVDAILEVMEVPMEVVVLSNGLVSMLSFL